MLCDTGLGSLIIETREGGRISHLCRGTSSNWNIILIISSQWITSKLQCASGERGRRVPYQITPCLKHREFDLLVLLMVTPVELKCGVELLVFLFLLWGVVIVVLQPLDSVGVANCSHGVWQGHSWVWLVGRNYRGSFWGGVVNYVGMAGNAGPADLVGATCLLAGYVPGPVGNLVVKDAGCAVG